MQRIYGDFNTLNSAPLGTVKLGQAGIDGHPRLQVGEVVELYDEEMEVAATISYDSAYAMWLATPDQRSLSVAVSLRLVVLLSNLLLRHGATRCGQRLLSSELLRWMLALH
jgi:hypothetical protein